MSSTTIRIYTCDNCSRKAETSHSGFPENWLRLVNDPQAIPNDRNVFDFCSERCAALHFVPEGFTP